MDHVVLLAGVSRGGGQSSSPSLLALGTKERVGTICKCGLMTSSEMTLRDPKKKLRKSLED